DRLAVNVRRAGERRTLGDLDVLPAVHAGDVGEPVVLGEDLRDAGLQRVAVEHLGDEEPGPVEAEHPHRDGDEHHDDAQDERELGLLGGRGRLRQRRVARGGAALTGLGGGRVARRAVALRGVVLVPVALVAVALRPVGLLPVLRGGVALRSVVRGAVLRLLAVARRRVALGRLLVSAVTLGRVALLGVALPAVLLARIRLRSAAGRPVLRPALGPPPRLAVLL